MSLIKPKPGDLVDRQSILELKIAHVESQKDFDNEPEQVVAHGAVARTVVSNPTKINVHPFVDELELIVSYLKKNWIPDILLDEDKVHAYDAHYEALKEVNAQLWDLEDKARTLRDAPDNFQEEACRRAAEVLFSITSLNDKRADIVRRINKLWSIDLQEKLYDV
jgi:hypothetical protein